MENNISLEKARQIMMVEFGRYFDDSLKVISERENNDFWLFELSEDGSSIGLPVVAINKRTGTTKSLYLAELPDYEIFKSSKEVRK